MAHFFQSFIAFVVAFTAIVVIAPDDSRWTDVFAIALAFLVSAFVGAFILIRLRGS